MLDMPSPPNATASLFRPLLSGSQPWGPAQLLVLEVQRGRENLLGCRGPREAAHPKGCGAPCPSCLLRHIPGICILCAVTPWDILPSPPSHRLTPVLQGKGMT